MESEAELVALMVAYQGGSLAAFEALYAALMPPLRRYLAGRAPAAAADLVQEAFLEMHRSRRTYTPPLPVMPWAFGVARNVERRHWRRLKRHDSRFVALAPEDDARGEAPARLAPADVEDAVQRLPAAGRDAWVLHHVHGLSFPEIAGRLRIEAGAARLRAHRAMVALRGLLGIERGGGRD